MYYVWYRVLQGTFTKEVPLFYVTYWRANLPSYENEPSAIAFDNQQAS